MCRGAGNAASAFGAALQVDSARTGATEKHPTPRAARDDDGDADGSDAVEGAGAESPEDAETASRRGGSSAGGGGGESGESMRAELLAMQLIECANEMEEYLTAQVKVLWGAVEFMRCVGHKGDVYSYDSNICCKYRHSEG